MAYNESDYLPLSGLQHFSFCRRQWALIHVEELWKENLRTVEGHILHERAHDISLRERRGDVVTVRGANVFSSSMGVSGQCDVLEYHRDPIHGVPVSGMEGLWVPYPVEYKRGAPKESHADLLQLCGQAMCLEEMLCCDVPEGALFYGETRRRLLVTFSQELRREVREDLEEMHYLYQRGHTPKVRPSKSCNACSLKELCLPGLTRTPSASAYLAKAMEESS